MLTATLTIKAENREELIKFLQFAVTQVTNGDDDIYSVFDKNKIEGTILDEEEQRRDFEEAAGYKLSDNQVKFCQEAEDDVQDIDYTYSGRGMYGNKCPAVRIGRDDDDFKSTAKTQTDGMGTEHIIYAQKQFT
jgi:hypothetical protein